MTDETNNPETAALISQGDGELNEMLREVRAKKRHAESEDAQRQWAGIAVVQQTIDLKLAEHRARIAVLERAYQAAEPGDLRPGQRLDKQRVQDSHELAPLYHERERLTRLYTAASPGFGTNIKNQGALAKDAKPAPKLDDEMRIVSNNLNTMPG
jgi:hypothetical protein